MGVVSKSQEKLFIWALSCKNGEVYSDNVKKLAESMTMEELENYSLVPFKEMPEEIKMKIVECLDTISDEDLKILEDAQMTTLGDVPGMGNVKAPTSADTNPAVPPGMDKAGSGDTYPDLFRPSTFKLPMKKKAKEERRIMTWDDFLKRINYQTHDSVLQRGHGQNLTGKNA